MSFNLDTLFLEPADLCLEPATASASTRDSSKAKGGEQLLMQDRHDYQSKGNDSEQSRLQFTIAYLSQQRDQWKAQAEEHAKIIADLDQRASTDAACSNLPYNVLRRINRLESEIARLRLENAHLKESCKTTERANVLLGNQNENKDNKLKGAKKKVKNAKQVADREETKAKEAVEAKQRHLASQRKMKKERDDALAAMEEQKKLNDSLRGELEMEQCGAPHVRDAAADANNTLVVVPIEFEARRVDIPYIMAELDQRQGDIIADVETWYKEWRELRKEGRHVPDADSCEDVK